MKLTPIILTLSFGIVINASATMRYVNVNNTNAAAPYTSWATAATNIQVAIDVSVAGDEIVVTNGLYQTGGRDYFGSSRVAVTKAVTVRSVNGPGHTVIRGYQQLNSTAAVRCVYLTNGAALIGFTLANGGTWPVQEARFQSGGGAMCESTNAVLSNCVLVANIGTQGGGVYRGTLYNCTLTGNSASPVGGGAFESTLNNCTLISNSAGFAGGGARSSILNSCILTGNSAGDNGGGAVLCTLNNCTVTGNSASFIAGGTFYSTVFNCIVYSNSAPKDPNYKNYNDSALYFSCSTPLPPGPGNYTNSPLFVDYLGGNLRLQSNSPCINSGRNSGSSLGPNLSGTGAPSGPDLDGSPRIVGGAVDVGAYEFQSPLSVISYAWLQQYGLPIDGSVDHADADMDQFDNWQESRAATLPFDATSFLKIDSVSPGGAGILVTWQCVNGLPYVVERTTDLGQSAQFTPVVTRAFPYTGTASYLDYTATGSGPFFYRVGIPEK